MFYPCSKFYINRLRRSCFMDTYQKALSRTSMLQERLNPKCALPDGPLPSSQVTFNQRLLYFVIVHRQTTNCNAICTTKI